MIEEYPFNIHPDEIKLTDFGISKILIGTLHANSLGGKVVKKKIK